MKKHLINITKDFFELDNYFEEILENEPSNSSNLEIKEINILDESDNKHKKILLFLIFLFIILGGIGAYYYAFSFNSIETIESNLKIIENVVDKTTYLQIKSVIEEILNNSSKKKSGLILLDLFNMITQPERVKNEQLFHESLNRIISLLNKKD